MGDLDPNQASIPSPLHWKCRVLPIGLPGEVPKINFLTLLVFVRFGIMADGFFVSDSWYKLIIKRSVLTWQYTNAEFWVLIRGLKHGSANYWLMVWQVAYHLMNFKFFVWDGCNSTHLVGCLWLADVYIGATTPLAFSFTYPYSFIPFLLKFGFT